MTYTKTKQTRQHNNIWPQHEAHCERNKTQQNQLTTHSSLKIIEVLLEHAHFMYEDHWSFS